MVTDFWRESTKNSTAYSPSFCAVAFHNGWEDQNMDARVNTAGKTSTSDKKLIKFEYCRRVCAHDDLRCVATHLDLIMFARWRL